MVYSSASSGPVNDSQPLCPMVVRPAPNLATMASDERNSPKKSPVGRKRFGAAFCLRSSNHTGWSGTASESLAAICRGRARSRPLCLEGCAKGLKSLGCHASEVPRIRVVGENATEGADQAQARAAKSSLGEAIITRETKQIRFQEQCRSLLSTRCPVPTCLGSKDRVRRSRDPAQSLERKACESV